MQAVRQVGQPPDSYGPTGASGDLERDGDRKKDGETGLRLNVGFAD